jgi:hypothetical protein
MRAADVKKYLDVLCEELDAVHAGAAPDRGRLRRAGFSVAALAALGLSAGFEASCSGKEVPLYAAVDTSDSSDSDSSVLYAGPPVEDCDNKVDDDGDKLVDCDDDDCDDDAACTGGAYRAPPV